MKKTVYIVTGAAGHLGSTIVRELLAAGAEVRALLLPSETTEVRPGLTVIRGNICDKDTLAPLFKRDSEDDMTVIHCAGIVTIYEKMNKKVYDVNVGGTKTLLAAAAAAGVKRFVYISSVHAIPTLPKGETMREVASFDPAGLRGCYAKTKAAASQAVLEMSKSGMETVIVHPSGIIGPFGLENGNVARMMMSYVRGRFHVAAEGGFDFVDVRDVAHGAILAAERGRNGECYLLTNRYIPLRELFGTLSRVSGVKPIRTFLPMWFAYAVSPLAELFYMMIRKPPLFTPYSMYTLSGNAMYSHERATLELGYTTRPLDETLRDTVRWIRSGSKKAALKPAKA